GVRQSNAWRRPGKQKTDPPNMGIDIIRRFLLRLGQQGPGREKLKQYVMFSSHRIVLRLLPDLDFFIWPPHGPKRQRGDYPSRPRLYASHGDIDSGAASGALPQARFARGPIPNISVPPSTMSWCVNQGLLRGAPFNSAD